MARIQDVATAANVSKATVSYVFSPEKNTLISPETRQKVLDAARKLGYKPSFIGKALSKQRTYNVALVLPARTAHSMSQHLLRIFHGIVNSAEKSEYTVSTFFGVSKRFISRAETHRFDGVIVVGLGSDRIALDRLAALNLPMVVLNREYTVNEHIGCVRSDLAGWFLSETEHFLNNNCRNILLLNKGLYADSGRELTEALPMALERVQAAGGKLEYLTMNDDGSLALQLQAFLQSHQVDALIVNGSMAGTYVLSALSILNKVPGRDIKISGFFRDYNALMLGFTWQHDSEAIGKQGWMMLENMISGKKGSYQLLPLVNDHPPKSTSDNAQSGFDV